MYMAERVVGSKGERLVEGMVENKVDRLVEKKITCIICPIGCDIIVQGEGQNISHLSGNQCNRGLEYAKNEFLSPVRILTTTIRVLSSNSPLVSVRSDRPIPRELIFQCMEEIKGITVEAPISRYDVLVSNILGVGVNIIATSEVGEEYIQKLTHV